MSALTEELISSALRVAADGLKEWSDLQKIRDRAVSEITPCASGSLRHFQVRDDDFREGHFRIDGGSDIPEETSYLADMLWTSIGGHSDPNLAKKVIAVSCIEFSRAQLDSLIVGLVITSSVRHPVREYARERARIIPEIMRARDWSNADEVSRDPTPSTWFKQSASFEFNDWLHSCKGDSYTHEEREPWRSLGIESDAVCLRAGIALVWLDEAISGGPRSITLMAEVAAALGDSSFQAGWKSRGEMDCEDRRSFAMKGADARHRGNREVAEKIKAAFREGEFSSKDRAAEILSRQFGTGYRTARDHLKNL